MIRTWLCLIAATATVVAQNFEAASVKPASRVTGWIRAIKEENPTRLRLQNHNLRFLIQDAWDLKPWQIRGPVWLARERYDITATKIRGTTPEQSRAMMRALLAERFHLAAHHETVEMNGYALRTVKSNLLHPAKDEVAVPGCRSFGSMAELADLVSAQLDKPVVDQTGIPGNYYFILAYSNSLPALPPGSDAPAPPPPAPPPCPGWDVGTMPPLAPSLEAALKDQMGLKLFATGKVKVDVLVVDHAERTPTAN